MLSRMGIDTHTQGVCMLAGEHPIHNGGHPRPECILTHPLQHVRCCVSTHPMQPIGTAVDSLYRSLYRALDIMWRSCVCTMQALVHSPPGGGSWNQSCCAPPPSYLSKIRGQGGVLGKDDGATQEGGGVRHL